MIICRFSDPPSTPDQIPSRKLELESETGAGVGNYRTTESETGKFRSRKLQDYRVGNQKLPSRKLQDYRVGNYRTTESETCNSIGSWKTIRAAGTKPTFFVKKVASTSKSHPSTCSATSMIIFLFREKKSLQRNESSVDLLAFFKLFS